MCTYEVVPDDLQFLYFHNYSPVFKMGDNCLSVPMSLFADNRRRLCERLKAREDVPSGAILILQGGEQKCQDSSDRELVFRQVGSIFIVCACL